MNHSNSSGRRMTVCAWEQRANNWLDRCSRCFHLNALHQPGKQLSDISATWLVCQGSSMPLRKRRERWKWCSSICPTLCLSTSICLPPPWCIWSYSSLCLFHMAQGCLLNVTFTHPPLLVHSSCCFAFFIPFFYPNLFFLVTTSSNNKKKEEETERVR